MIMIINSIFYYWEYDEDNIWNKEIRNVIKKHQKSQELILIKLLLYNSILDIYVIK